MFIIKYRKIFFGISIAVVFSALAAVAVYGLHFGIEFTGGEIIEAKYATLPEKTAVSSALEKVEIGAFSLREANGDAYILRTKSLSEQKRKEVFAALGGEITRFNSVGPTIGQELRRKAGAAIALVVIAIILFIAFVFRHVSRPVSSWKYGWIAIVALLHDIIVPVGLFAVLGHFFGAEVDVLFVMAVLAILGYSVNDTIVVFDRVREHLNHNARRHKKEDFDKTVGKSLNETFMRSINTSFTTLLVLLALYFVGPKATHYFALVLIAGVIAGTYSSLFLATPLLTVVKKMEDA